MYIDFKLNPFEILFFTGEKVIFLRFSLRFFFKLQKKTKKIVFSCPLMDF